MQRQKQTRKKRFEQGAPSSTAQESFRSESVRGERALCEARRPGTVPAPGWQSSVAGCPAHLRPPGGCFGVFHCLVYCAGALLLRTGFSSVQPAAAGLPCGAQAFQRPGFSAWGAQALGVKHMGLRSCRRPAQELCTQAVHAESSRTRNRTCVPCISRWIPIHCTTREAPPGF